MREFMQITFKIWQNRVTENRSVPPPHNRRIDMELPMERGHMGTFWDSGKLLYFDLGGGYVGVYICEN